MKVSLNLKIKPSKIEKLNSFVILIIKLKIMFGDMMNMMGKLKETQKKVEETKKRLDTVLVDESSNDNKLKITLTANRTIKAIEIDDELLQDKEQLEDYLILTLNKAIEKATKVNEAELGAVAKEGMPNIPGMDLFK
jgi:DNA-binding YbaB/EbfC family protein